MQVGGRKVSGSSEEGGRGETKGPIGDKVIVFCEVKGYGERRERYGPEKSDGNGRWPPVSGP